MSFKEFYLSRKVASDAGFGRKIWMLKLPRIADNLSSGRNILGSLVEERDLIINSYPIPFSMTTPAIFLTRLNELRTQLGFAPDEDFILKQKIPNTSINIRRSDGLSAEGTSNFPGVPINLGLSVERESILEVNIILNDGAEFQYIPTEYMSRLAGYFDGDDEKAFPNLFVDVDDELFVDLIILAKNYSLIYKSSQSLGSGFEAEANAVNAEFGGNLNIAQTSEISFEIKLNDNNEYVLGFKTIDWDDLH